MAPFVPERAPSPINTPNYSVDAPRSAFGGAAAEALESVGTNLKQASGELYERGMAIQELQNRAEASDASSQFMAQSGDIYADYTSKLGKDGVEGLKPFQKSMEELRHGIGGSITNPAARRMYDAETKATMGRTLFSGAQHSKTQLKAWEGGSAEAVIAANGDRALANPTDDIEFQKGLQATRDAVDRLASIKGYDEDQKAQELAQRTSSLWEKRVAGLADKQPFAAQKMLSEAVSRGDIRGESIAKITQLVNQRMYTVGAREVSRGVNSGADLAIGASGVDIRSARYAIGQFESGGNYEALGPEVSGRGRALGKYQVMPENLAPWLKQAGLDPMTPQEFLKNPKAQDAVFDTIFGDYLKKHGNFNDAASLWFTGTTAAEAKAQGRNDKYTSIQGYLQGTNALLAKNASLDNREVRARERAKALSPEDPLFEDYVVNRVHTDYNLQQRTKTNDDFNNRQTIEGGIVGMIGKGQLPTSVDELKALGPEVAMAWDNLEPDKQRRYLGQMAKNAKGETALTEEGLARWKELKGMAQADPKAFMDVDILEESLPIATKKELIGEQIKKKDKAEGDPRVLHAVSLLRPQMEAAGLTTKDDRPGVYRFMGALQDQLQTYQEDNKKPADAKTINEIGARLLQQQATPGWINRWATTPTFSMPIPATEAPKIKQFLMEKNGGREPTEDAMQRFYAAVLYQRLHSKPKEGGKP